MVGDCCVKVGCFRGWFLPGRCRCVVSPPWPIAVSANQTARLLPQKIGSYGREMSLFQGNLGL